MQCCETVAVSERGEGCPRCGSYQLQVTAGTEMRVKELEVS
jgi:hydrogenase nickel incorporation protein HypA/HybF